MRNSCVYDSTTALIITILQWLLPKYRAKYRTVFRVGKGRAIADENMEIIEERSIKIWHENCYLRLSRLHFDWSVELSTVSLTRSSKNWIPFDTVIFFSDNFSTFSNVSLLFLSLFFFWFLFFSSSIVLCLCINVSFLFVTFDGLFLFCVIPIKLAAMPNFKQLNFLVHFFFSRLLSKQNTIANATWHSISLYLKSIFWYVI